MNDRVPNGDDNAARASGNNEGAAEGSRMGDDLIEDSGKIDVNMFRQHSSPSPSQDDLEEQAPQKGKADLATSLDNKNQASPDAAAAEGVIVTNPVLVGAMQQTSRFDAQYEQDMDGGNVTLDLKTDRLKQFPEAYEML